MKVNSCHISLTYYFLSELQAYLNSAVGCKLYPVCNHLQLQVLIMEEFDFWVLHSLPQLPQWIRHVHSSFRDTAEVNREVGAVLGSLINDNDQVVIFVVVFEKLQLGHHDFFAPGAIWVVQCQF